jgi:hypothetical protein
MASADVEAPTVQTLIDIRGTAAAPVHNLSFDGLLFE